MTHPATPHADRRSQRITVTPRASGDLFHAGQILDGTYEVRKVLGSGGMGQVFEAVDRSLGRKVAIKAAWPTERGSQLKFEAQALAAFWHPSLPVVHCLRCHDGVDFVVMERVYGVTLTDHIARIRETRASASVDEAIGIVSSVAEALGVVHEAGLAHLDVKPDNIMLTPDRRAVLVDFGLALPEFNVASQARIAGTPRYLAPEVVAEFLEPGAGRLVDIYALGVTLFEVLTGDVPRSVSTFEELLEIDRDADIDVRAARPDVPGELAHLVNEMLALDPGLRPQSADMVTWALRAIGRHTHDQTPVKVLVVDDDIHVGRTLEFYTRRALGSVSIRSARSGPAALDELRRWTPDIMLLDLSMPQMSGIEVCMYVSGANLASNCTIVPVTAAANLEDKELLRTLGIRHFIVKDAQLCARLTATLRSLCGRAGRS